MKIILTLLFCTSSCFAAPVWVKEHNRWVAYSMIDDFGGKKYQKEIKEREARIVDWDLDEADLARRRADEGGRTPHDTYFRVKVYTYPKPTVSSPLWDLLVWAWKNWWP